MYLHEYLHASLVVWRCLSLSFFVFIFLLSQFSRLTCPLSRVPWCLFLSFQVITNYSAVVGSVLGEHPGIMAALFENLPVREFVVSTLARNPSPRVRRHMVQLFVGSMPMAGTLLRWLTVELEASWCVRLFVVNPLETIRSLKDRVMSTKGFGSRLVLIQRYHNIIRVMVMHVMCVPPPSPVPPQNVILCTQKLHVVSCRFLYAPL